MKGMIAQFETSKVLLNEKIQSDFQLRTQVYLLNQDNQEALAKINTLNQVLKTLEEANAKFIAEILELKKAKVIEEEIQGEIDAIEQVAE